MQEHTADGKTFKIPSFGVIWRLESDEVSNDKGMELEDRWSWGLSMTEIIIV